MLKQTQSELKKKFRAEITELKDAILIQCYECSGYQGDGYSDCQIKSCPLYQFRLKSNIGNRSERLQRKARKFKKVLSQ